MVDARRDRTLAADIGDIEQVAVGALRGLDSKRLDRLVVHAPCTYRDELTLRITQRRELAAEHAAGVDADRAIEPLGLGDRCVAVDDHRGTAIVRGPVVANRQAELVALAGRLA